VSKLVTGLARPVLAEGVTAAVPVILDVSTVDVRLNISHINSDTSTVDFNILNLEHDPKPQFHARNRSANHRKEVARAVQSCGRTRIGQGNS
jgi:hypothetical protein